MFPIERGGGRGGKPERIYSWIGNEIEIQECPSDGRLQKRCGDGPAKAPCEAEDIGDRIPR